MSIKYCLVCGNWFPGYVKVCEVCGTIYDNESIEFRCDNGKLVKLSEDEVKEIFLQMQEQANKISLEVE